MKWYDIATWAIDAIAVVASGVAIYYAIQAGRSAKRARR